MGLFQKLKKNKNANEARPLTYPPKLRGKSGGHRYSFSGADADVYVWFDGLEHLIAPLESIQTLSVSVHESKGQARALGHRGVRGLSRGMRTIAGSMILTVIEDNPLRPLMENIHAFLQAGGNWPGWSIDRDLVGTGTALGGMLNFDNRIAPLLPPINVLVQYVSETSLWSRTDPNVNVLDIEGAGMLLRGVEFIDEGIVTSTHDVVSEVTLSFIACDYKPIAAQIFKSSTTGRPDNVLPIYTSSFDEQKHTEFLRELYGASVLGGIQQNNERMKELGLSAF
jgi:hypothetical protein